MSKFLDCPYCQGKFLWVETCRCATYIYYDYIENELFLSRANPHSWKSHYGDYNLVYLGEL